MHINKKIYKKKKKESERVEKYIKHIYRDRKQKMIILRLLWKF